MATFGDLIEEVLLNLEGYAGEQGVFGVLQTGIGATDTTFTINGPVFGDGSGFSTGLVEIGEEIVNVLNLDRSTGIATATLRGWRGSTPAIWSAGTLLRNDPKYPRLAVRKALNDTITTLLPKFGAIKSYEFQALGAKVRYDMPADCRGVLEVSFSVPGASKAWESSYRFKFDNVGGSDSTTGKSLNIWDFLPGRLVRVVYWADPSPLVNLSDNFALTTGLVDWINPTVIYGACYRLSSFADAGNIADNSASQKLINTTQASSFGNQTISKYFNQLFQQGISEAELRLQNMYPPSIHRTY